MIGPSKRFHPVDLEGDSYDDDNPLPVKVTDLEVTADTVNLNTTDLETLLEELINRTNISGVIYDADGNPLTIKRDSQNVNAGGTDTELVAGVASKKIRVLAMLAIAGTTATALTLRSKPAGAGADITPLMSNGVNGGEVLPFNRHGWCETVAGEALAVTTGAGSATGILVMYVEV